MRRAVGAAGYHARDEYADEPARRTRRTARHPPQVRPLARPPLGVVGAGPQARGPAAAGQRGRGARRQAAASSAAASGTAMRASRCACSANDAGRDHRRRLDRREDRPRRAAAPRAAAARCGQRCLARGAQRGRWPVRPDRRPLRRHPGGGVLRRRHVEIPRGDPRRPAQRISPARGCAGSPRATCRSRSRSTAAAATMPAPVEVHEHGLRFHAAPGLGHKTGFFADQRDNRRRFAELAKGRRVLDLCCNAGGFAVHAMAAGAREAVGVDMDAGILEIARANAAANDVEVTLRAGRHLRLGACRGRPRRALRRGDPRSGQAHPRPLPR